MNPVLAIVHAGREHDLAVQIWYDAEVHPELERIARRQTDHAAAAAVAAIRAGAAPAALLKQGIPAQLVAAAVEAAKERPSD